MGAAKRNIVLVGMRASGKTTLGQTLAERLGLDFTDLDDECGRLAGRSVDALLAEEGEAALREIEARALAGAARTRGHVVATGGGAVLHGEVFEALAATGTVVYLEGDAATLAARARARPRPRLRGGALEDEVAALLTEREPLYLAAADLVVTLDEADPVAAILAGLDGESER